MKSIVVILLLASLLYPWGFVGHETIALIAEHQLSPETIQKLKPLLNGYTIEEASVWADKIKGKRRDTAPWHYINLPVSQNITKQDIPKYEIPTGDIITELNQEIAFLKTGKGSQKERSEALFFIIHFVGDLHMPLHVGEDGDRGGNDKTVRYFSPKSNSNQGHVTNLHSLWDNIIEIKADDDPQEYATELNSHIDQAEKEKWAKGSIEDWAFETYTVSKTKVYKDLPEANAKGIIILPKDYHALKRPVADEQLEKAGVRLAKILEMIIK